MTFGAGQLDGIPNTFASLIRNPNYGDQRYTNQTKFHKHMYLSKLLDERNEISPAILMV